MLLNSVFSINNHSFSKVTLEKNSSSKAASALTLSIKGFLNNSISKSIDEYTTEEWTLQQGLLSELVVRMGNVEQDSKGNTIKDAYIFYTIEDLKNSIKSLGKEAKLKFVEEFTKEDFNMKLFSEEGMIMKMLG